jgi:sulfite reductase (NADPH) hemoprotein beta-component
MVGTAAGKYNLHIGGDNQGLRLNKLYKENLDETALLSNLDELFGLFKTEKQPKESFGDFVMRKKLVP